MSGGLDITHGGAISVDSDALRDAATRIDGLITDFEEARAAVARAYDAITEAPELDAGVDTGALWASGERAGALREECESAVTGTRLMADAYEYVELQAEAEALALTDKAAADALLLRMEALAASDGRIPDMAAMLVRGWEDGRFHGLDGQFTLGGALAPLFSTAAFAGARLGLGKILPGMTLSGTADPVSVTPVKTTHPSGPPTSVEGALRRMPSTPDAQVKVEKYTFADGSTRFVTYIKGTAFPPSYGGAEPWDMKSNQELYTGEKSASYQATIDALEAAGAQPGDQVDIVAYSQGGMIAAHLSMESEYDVRMQITMGSPNEPTLDDDQTLVQGRHTDDLVSALAGGGSPQGTGSPDSFTATREGDPLDGIQDVLMAPHKFEAYLDTARMIDESGDPRAEALDEFWAGLEGATTIESTEYHAERTG